MGSKAWVPVSVFIVPGVTKPRPQFPHPWMRNFEWVSSCLLALVVFVYSRAQQVFTEAFSGTTQSTWGHRERRPVTHALRSMPSSWLGCNPSTDIFTLCLKEMYSSTMGLGLRAYVASSRSLSCTLYP